MISNLGPLRIRLSLDGAAERESTYATLTLRTLALNSDQIWETFACSMNVALVSSGAGYTMKLLHRTNHQTLFSRNAVSGQGGILGKEWMFCVFEGWFEANSRASVLQQMIH